MNPLATLIRGKTKDEIVKFLFTKRIDDTSKAKKVVRKIARMPSEFDMFKTVVFDWLKDNPVIVDALKEFDLLKTVISKDDDVLTAASKTAYFVASSLPYKSDSKDVALAKCEVIADLLIQLCNSVHSASQDKDNFLIKE